MSTYKRSSQGFRIDVATGAPAGDGILLTEADLASMGGVKSLVSALRKAFKNKLAPPVLTDGSVFLACLTNDESMFMSTAQLVADMAETVADLERNASQEHPAPIEQVTKSAGLVDVLEAAADSFRKHRARLVVENNDGDWEIPILDPSVFVRPEKPETLDMKDTYPVCGYFYDVETGGHILLIGASKLEIALPLNDPKWALTNIWWAADGGTFLVARLQRASKHARWTLVGDAKLVGQDDLAPPSDA